MVVISISLQSIEKIKAIPDLPQKEMQFIKQWQQEGTLENFFLAVSKTGAVLIFKDISEAKAKELIETLPYFPYMSKVDYFNLEKHF
jgi:hypothetical protein